MRPVISVIVPTCRRPLLLKRSLLSLLLQHNAPPFEIIVADGCPDASTRRVFNEVLHLASFNPSIVSIEYYARWTRGPAQTKNLGLEKAQGEYTTILDDDDMLFPYALHVATKIARLLRARLVTFDVITTSDCRSLGRTPRAGYVQRITPKDYYCGRFIGEYWGLTSAAVKTRQYPPMLYASEMTLYLQQYREEGGAVYVKLPMRVYETRTVSTTRTLTVKHETLLKIILDYLVHLHIHLDEYLRLGCQDTLCEYYIKRLARAAKLAGESNSYNLAQQLYREICEKRDKITKRIVHYLSLNGIIYKVAKATKYTRDLLLARHSKDRCDYITLMWKSLECYKRLEKLINASGDAWKSIDRFAREMNRCIFNT